MLLIEILLFDLRMMNELMVDNRTNGPKKKSIYKTIV